MTLLRNGELPDADCREPIANGLRYREMLPIRGDKKATDARTAGNRILRSEHTAMSAMGQGRLWPAR